MFPKRSPAGQRQPFFHARGSNLEPVYRFRFGNIEFHRRFADVKIHLRQRVTRASLDRLRKRRTPIL